MICAFYSLDAYHHLPARVVSFHHFVCFANFFEVKPAQRFRLVPASSHVYRADSRSKRHWQRTGSACDSYAESAHRSRREKLGGLHSPI